MYSGSPALTLLQSQHPFAVQLHTYYVVNADSARMDMLGNNAK